MNTTKTITAESVVEAVKALARLFEEPAPEPDNPIPRFRDWWWDEFDSEGDAAEYHAGSPEAAKTLLPILHGLVTPDFEIETVGPILRLRRVCEMHYPRRPVVADSGDAPE